MGNWWTGLVWALALVVFVGVTAGGTVLAEEAAIGRELTWSMASVISAETNPPQAESLALAKVPVRYMWERDIEDYRAIYVVNGTIHDWNRKVLDVIYTGPYLEESEATWLMEGSSGVVIIRDTTTSDEFIITEIRMQ